MSDRHALLALVFLLIGCNGSVYDGTGGSVGCPSGAGPEQVVAGGICIDTTEVTQAQYREFLQADPEPECSWNGSLEPACNFEPEADADQPVTCVDYCDAATYCKWAGKRLCTDNEWGFSCSNGGETKYPYGDNYQADACSVSLGPVGTGSCRGVEPPFSEVFDMLGNAEEWVDTGEGKMADFECRAFSARPDSDEVSCNRRISDRCDNTNPELGFRCCSDPI